MTTMKELVEKVARAILVLEDCGDLSEEAADKHLAATEHAGDCTGESFTCMKCYADEHRGIAHAAVLATLDCLKEPDKYVRAAGQWKLLEPSPTTSVAACLDANAKALEVWQAMIDHIAQEKP